jgi:uncharacterized protein (TIGR02217 family)
MTHLTNRLPREIELGAVRREDYGTEVVETDGGFEHRNNRWANPKRTYEVSFPTSLRNGSVYQAVVALYEMAQGSLHSFNFVDWTDETGGTVVSVRFDSPLEITGVATHLDHIETLTLREVFL